MIKNLYCCLCTKTQYSFFILNFRGIVERVGVWEVLVNGVGKLLKYFNMWVKLFVEFFFNCYLAAPRPTLGHYQGDSLNHSMLITAFCIFELKVTGKLVSRLCPYAQSSAQWGLNQEPSDSYYNTLTHQATLPKVLIKCD